MPVDQNAFHAAAERTQQRQRLRPRDTFVAGEQGRYDSSTAKAFMTLMQRHASPLPRSRRLIEQCSHAVRADSSRINDAAIVHAPQERVVLEDRPLHACEGCRGCPKRAFDGGARPRVLALLELRRPDACRQGPAASNRPIPHA